MNNCVDLSCLAAGSRFTDRDILNEQQLQLLVL